MSSQHKLHLIMVLLTTGLSAQTGIITTIAGTGVTGSDGVGGPAVYAQLTYPTEVCVDTGGNIYISDSGNNRIVRVDASTGILTLVAGNGTAASGGDGGPAVQASLNNPRGIALDAAGNLLIAEFGANRIRRVDLQTGLITTVAGTGTAGFGGDGGPAINASFNLVLSIAFDAAGNLYIADSGNARLRRVDAQTGIITTVAGDGTSAIAPDGIPAINATLSPPLGVSLDRAGNLLIAEYGSARIRRIDRATGILGTVAGSGTAAFTGDGVPAVNAGIGKTFSNVAADAAGNLFFSDGTGRVRRVDAATGIITTIAGNGSGAQGQHVTAGCFTTAAGDNAQATTVTLDGPYGTALTSNGNLLVSDFLDCRVRRIYIPSPFPYTNTSLTSTAVNVTQGQPVTFTATVSPIGASGIPSGGIRFVDQPQSPFPTVLGTRPLDGGSASLTVTTLSAQSTHLVAAFYLPDSGFNGSGSPAIAVTVSTAVKPSPNIALSVDHINTTVLTPVIFTAAVTPPPGNPIQPTGPVVLYDGAVPVQTVSLSNGIAQFTQSYTALGTHMMSVIYQGDSTYSWVTSPTLSETVIAPASVSLTSSTNPSNAGAFVTFTASVSPATATGSVQFNDGPAVLGNVSLANGVAVLWNSTLTAGTHPIQAVYSGDSSFAGASSPVLNQIVKAGTTTSITSSAAASTYGQAVTFTASISPASATGTIQFMDGAVSLGTVAVSSGSASITTTSLTAGSHSIIAMYSGDGTNAASNSAALSIDIAKAAASAALAASPNPSIPNQVVTLTASVSPAAAPGQVEFYDGTTLIGVSALSSGIATVNKVFTAGTHSLTAVYTGDLNFTAATSPAVSETVKAPTTTSIAGAGTSTFGQPVQLTATVSPAAASGSVQFLDGAAPLGTVALSGGSAPITLSSLAVGSHVITAVYGGDGSYQASTSAGVTHIVQKINVTVTLSSSVNPSIAGQAVVFSAALSVSSATGTIQFLDGNAVIGTQTVASGSASLSVATLAIGTHSISAAYSGDATDAAGTSAPYNQTVRPAAPSNLTATAANSSVINLRWTASPTAGVIYRVYASTVPGFTPGPDTLFANGISGTTYAADNLSHGTTVYFRVTAWTQGSESAPSNQAVATTRGH